MKTTKYLFAVLLFALTALNFQSCSDKDNGGSVPATFITVVNGAGSEIETLNLPLSASHQMLGVKADSLSVWTASSDQDWCKISNHEGYGYGKDSLFYVRVDVEKNEGSRRQAVVTFTSGSAVKTITIAQRGSDMDPGDPFESSYTFIDNINVGYNLGNTLDSDPELPSSWWNPKSDLDWETVWGQPKTTQAMLTAIVSEGFNVIRIPVTWHPHMDANNIVSEVWMNRVQEVVDYVLNAVPDQKTYCILNVQHDNGARNGRTDGGGWLSADPKEYEANSVKFKALWQQIAMRFKDYDDRLLFEAFNEILDGKDTWGDPSAECYPIVCKLEQDFLDVVRATGGNNEYRNCVVNTYSAGSTPAKLAGFEVPEDIHPNHLLASIHSYDPYSFCNDNGEWNIPMFDEACTKEIDDLTKRVNDRFNTLGIPYVYGEFGAIDEKKDMGERVKYAKYMMSKFQQYKTKGLWWMGLYNRRSKKWYEQEIVNALLGK